jgi:Zn-dependent oligopeptidase
MTQKEKGEYNLANYR